MIEKLVSRQRFFLIDRISSAAMAFAAHSNPSWSADSWPSHEKRVFPQRGMPPAIRHAPRRTGAGSIASEGEVKKLVETAAPVLSEWLTGDEPRFRYSAARIKCGPLPVSRLSRRSSRRRASRMMCSRSAARPLGADDSDRAHGLHFAGSIA